MKIEYEKNGDYLIPKLDVKSDLDFSKLNKYGLLRYEILKEFKEVEFQQLLLENKMQKHLLDMQKEIKIEMKRIIQELTEKENITEDLKEKNHLEWTGAMNNIKNRAEEVILKQIILRDEVI